MDLETFDKNSKCVSRFSVGETVLVKNLRHGSRWLPGIITEVLQRAYLVQVSQNVWKRHEGQLPPRFGICRNSTPEEIALLITADQHGFNGSESITP